MDYLPKHLLNDDIVFHYTSVDIAIQHILFEGKLRLSPRKRSVDPVENLHFNSSSYLWGEVDENLFTLGRKIQKNAENKVNKCKQVCFCKSKQENNKAYWEGSELDSFGFLKPRMWDQYGDMYKGVCLAFSKSELIKKGDFDFKDIDYVDFIGMIENELVLDLGMIESKGELACTDEFDKKVLGNLFRKHQDYSGENEFRICSFSKNEYDWIDINKALRAIIVSPLYINEFAKDRIMEYSVRYGVEVIGVNWKSEGVDIRQYKLKVVEDRVDDMNN